MSRYEGKKVTIHPHEMTPAEIDLRNQVDCLGKHYTDERFELVRKAMLAVFCEARDARKA